MNVLSSHGKAYCNCLAQQRGLDPAGHGGDFDDAIVVEVPLPWRADMLQQAGPLPQQIIDVAALWLQQYYAGEGYPHLPLAIAPDAAYARTGYRRVMSFTRPAGLFSRFDKVEYVVPEDAVGPLVWALYQAREALPRFTRYLVPDADSIRDILVCTHGTVDAACAKFGYPLYKHIRDACATDQSRVWRVSHFGGHVFAPTLMDLPTGHFWAYVDTPQAAQIVHEAHEVAALRGHYRGWAGVASGFLQAAECSLWQHHGWGWLDYPRCGDILMHDEQFDTPRWAEVSIRYTVPPDTEEIVVQMRWATIRSACQIVRSRDSPSRVRCVMPTACNIIAHGTMRRSWVCFRALIRLRV